MSHLGMHALWLQWNVGRALINCQELENTLVAIQNVVSRSVDIFLSDYHQETNKIQQGEPS